MSLAAATRGRMPPEFARRVREIGRVIDPPATAELYAPLHPKEPYAGVKVLRDLKYGPDPRQAFDLFTPTTAGKPQPVLMFVHGGGFVGGTKRAPGSPFYDNIMLFAVRNGMIGVNVTYRLAPGHKWPAGAEDVAAAVRWTLDHIALHGGDPANVFLMGNSAGATHVATYVADPRFHVRQDGTGLRGAILLAGLYDLARREMPPNYVEYFGADPSLYGARSPLHGLLKTKLPLLVVCSELDPPDIERQTDVLIESLAGAGRSARTLKLLGHSHMSAPYSINTADTELSDAILEFIASASQGS